MSVLKVLETAALYCLAPEAFLLNAFTVTLTVAPFLTERLRAVLPASTLTDFVATATAGLEDLILISLAPTNFTSSKEIDEDIIGSSDSTSVKSTPFAAASLTGTVIATAASATTGVPKFATGANVNAVAPQGETLLVLYSRHVIKQSILI